MRSSLRHAFVLLLSIAAGCSARPASDSSDASPPASANTVLGRVKSIEPSGLMDHDARWRIVVEEIGSPSVLREFFVHSPVHTFSAPGEDVIGKQYRFILLDEVAWPYVGRLRVETPEGVRCSVP